MFATDNIAKGWMATLKQASTHCVYVYEMHVTMLNGSEITRKGFVNLIR
jgi:hypothetical protein